MTRFCPRAMVRSLLCVAGIGLMLGLAWYSRENLAKVVATMRPSVFLAAVLAGVGLALVQGVYFWRLMLKNGSASQAGEAIVAFLVSQPGKYLPGKVWSPLIQRASLGRGSSLLTIGVSNVELALSALAQMTSLGAACLAIHQPMLVFLCLLAGLLASTALLRFHILHWLAQVMPLVAARLGFITPATGAPQVGFIDALLYSAVIMASTLLASWLVLAAMGTGAPLSEQASILGTLFLGFSSSLLAFPVPAGVGVREAATAGIGLLTAPGIPEAQLITIALFARVWQLAVDLACLVLGLALMARRSG